MEQQRITALTAIRITVQLKSPVVGKMGVLNVSNLSKHFGGFTAVENVSFTIESAEILGLLGPNGAGKTTTIQMLLGVLTPSSGSISYFGRDLSTHRSEILEQVNFSSTYTNLPWNLTVKDVLRFLVYLYQIGNRAQRLQELIDNFELSSLLDKKIVSLSAGELTRLNLAKAFVNQPKVILLDEPTASLDPEAAQFIRQLILERRRREGLTVLFTSHNMAEVELLCDRVIFINQGCIVANNRPSELSRTLDQCSLTLMIDPPHHEALEDVCRSEKLTFCRDGDLFKIQLRETEISRTLQAIGSARISFHGITVTKPTLEDYFLSQAKNFRTSWQTKT
ncbi:MAG: hypothetical protein DCC75_00500 [Proteobacteria bacterium]|nr:MAG: hypothetical protein DCC75_00500 [Pseudomonadota bacterium]